MLHIVAHTAAPRLLYQIRVLDFRSAAAKPGCLPATASQTGGPAARHACLLWHFHLPGAPAQIPASAFAVASATCSTCCRTTGKLQPPSACLSHGRGPPALCKCNMLPCPSHTHIYHSLKQSVFDGCPHRLSTPISGHLIMRVLRTAVPDACHTPISGCPSNVSSGLLCLQDWAAGPFGPLHSRSVACCEYRTGS